MAAAVPTSAAMAQVKQIIPPLSPALHKGQAGRIGIVGGSKDYTGAPFFASMSSMKFGCDMSYTICSPDAGNTIKTYSPDLIVNRLLDDSKDFSQVEKELDELFERFHAVVIGPGLGRDDFMQSCARVCIKLARKHDMYVVVDADGLWLLQNEPEVIKGYKKAILTPNVAEFARLCKAVNLDPSSNPGEAAQQLAKALDGPTIVEKGGVDRIATATEVLQVSSEGSLKRSGGQGDILAGCLGTFAGWAKIYEESQGSQQSTESPRISPDRLLLLAGYGAALTARECSRLAYKKSGRAMLAHDLIEQVGVAYQNLWGDVQQKL